VTAELNRNTNLQSMLSEVREKLGISRDLSSSSGSLNTSSLFTSVS
jgi:hypothetical protein